MLAFYVVLNCHVGAGNQTQVIYESSEPSELFKRLSMPLSSRYLYPSFDSHFSLLMTNFLSSSHSLIANYRNGFPFNI